ncbi:MAG: hypothetical protein ACLPOO_16165 [Terriglobales bacterium]
MYKKTLLTLAVLVFASLTAFAASKDGIEISKDGRMVFAAKGASKASTPYVEENAGLIAIYDNVARKYPDGVYWCCEGYGINGPDNPVGFGGEWLAAGFTPSTSLNVKGIQVAVGYNPFGETFTDVIVTLNADSGGVPGAVLESWTVQIGSIDFGSCCTLETERSTSIPVTAGTQYWVVVSTEDNSDVVAAWNENDAKQLPTDAVPWAVYCTPASMFCSNPNVWVNRGTNYPAPAFAVYGK